MTELPVAVLTFVCLTGAALAGLFGAATHRSPTQNDINTTLRLVANIFVVLTSLLLGLMLDSAKNTFDTDNRNVNALATDLILLDRTMKPLGPQADEVRRRLTEYVQTALTDVSILEEDSKAGTLLDAVGASLRAIQVSNDQQVSVWNDARLLYLQIVRERWVVIDQLGGTIPTPLIVMLIVWLVAIFATFGYQAPRSRLVASSFVIAALLVSAALYLIVDMDQAGTGLIKTSNAPFQRALAHFQGSVSGDRSAIIRKAPARVLD